MGRLSKAELRTAKEIQALLQKPTLTIDEIERVYNDYNPAFDDNVTERGVFFSPEGLAMDTALFAHRGHVVDCCSGIGMLTYAMLTRNYYHDQIRSITLIEFNPFFLDMSRKLLSGLSAYTDSRSTIELNFVQGSAWDEALWTGVTSTLEGNRFDEFISNPPYGKASPEERAEAAWMHYVGDREVMAMELAWRYAHHATMIVPPSSCDFQFSGARYYDRRPSKKVDAMRKKMPSDFFMHHDSMGVDASYFRDEWKGTKITTEVVDVCFDRSQFE